MNAFRRGWFVEDGPWLRFPHLMPQVGWAIALIVVTVLTAAMVLVPSPAPTPVEAAAGLLSLAIIVIGYFTFGRFGLRPDRSGLPLQILLIGTTSIGAAFSPNVVWFQFFLYPAMWLSSKTVRGALIANVITFVATSTFAIGIVDRGPVTLRDIVIHFAFQSLGFLSSVAFGLWMAWLVSYSLERTDLLTELAGAQRKLEALSRQAGADAERRRISGDLHDAIAQSLASEVMLAQKLRRELEAGQPERLDETVALMEDIARDALKETRLLIAETAPPPAAHMDLADAASLLISRFERQTGITVQSTISPEVRGAQTRDAEVVVLRVIQEGLANVRKHAHASVVSVRIDQSDVTAVEVRDDGVGLRVGSAVDGDSGYGLPGMRERVEQLGGSLVLCSGSDSTERPGTILRVEIPTATRASREAVRIS